MNVIFLILLFMSYGVQGACLPDSDLTNKKSFAANLNINMKGIEEAASKFESIIVRELPKEQDFIIKLEPHNPRVNAEIIKSERDIVVSVWGGMLGHPFMTSDTFTLLLCHEIGHLLGGPPLKSRNGWSSTEGQADYYSTGNCARSFDLDEASFLEAALNLTRIYAEVTRQPMPKLESCDSSQVNRTNYGYPQAQCRLDTLLAGWRGAARPRCWFFQ